MTPDDKLTAARESFSGKTMTDSQLREAVAIADILHVEIHRSGTFIEKLTDYAHAFARNERFDAMRAEKVLRDTYTAVQGQSMNQTREGLQANEERLPEAAHARALACAETIGELIQAPPTQPFYQAYDRAAVTLATELQITQSGAKTLMKDAYSQAHNRDLYEHGKQIEDTYHKPVREAEIAQRKADRLQSQSLTQRRV
ncbi:MAG: hypothetical protein AAGC79_09175 [Pseudomonadota bacterium]